MATPDRQNLHSHTQAFLARHGGNIHLPDVHGNNGGTAHISLDPVTNTLQIAEYFGTYGAESQFENLLTIPRRLGAPTEPQNTAMFSDRRAIINGLRRAMRTELDQLDEEITEARSKLTPERNAVVTYFTDQLRHPSYPGKYNLIEDERYREVDARLSTAIAARLSPWQIKQFELTFARSLREYLDEDPSRFGDTVHIGIQYQPDYPLLQALEAAKIDRSVFPQMTEVMLEEGGTRPAQVREWHRHPNPHIGKVIYPNPQSQNV